MDGPFASTELGYRMLPGVAAGVAVLGVAGIVLIDVHHGFAYLVVALLLLLAAAMRERRSAKQVAHRLGERERALAEAQRLSKIGSFELDVQTREMTWSDELYRIFAADPARFRPTPEAWRARVHPSDRETVAGLIATETEQRGSWSFVHRIVRLDGVERTLEFRGRVECDARGRPIRILGTGQDVTGAKLAEDRIRSLFENAPYGLVIIDHDGAISMLNAAAEGLFGYPRGDVLGAPVELLVPAAARGGSWWEAPAEADCVEEPTPVGRRKDGTEFPVEISVSPIHTEEGSLLSVAVRDVTERRQAADALAHQATHDPLTGLPNRALFLDRLEHALARARRSRARLAVVFLDLDDFKLVNDTRGHDVGDLLLLVLAPRLDAALRPGDTIARFGGDEFVVLCEELGDEQAALTIAQRMTDACAQPVTIEGHVHTVTVSAGVAMLAPGQEASASDLLRDADAAMYRAKAQGGGRIELFDAGMRARLIDRVAVEAALRGALDRRELRVHYQPVISLRDGRIVGAEALLRWKHPERGLLGPAEFIAIAESTGLIVPIGEWVISEACRQAAVWNAELKDRDPLHVSVNLSPRQVVHSDVAEHVERVLEATGLDPVLLRLEITETTLLEDADACAQIVRELKALGVRIVLDDFGTGYSSLSYLKRLTIDALKIDRSFVGGLGRDTEDSAIVGAVLSIANALDVGVTAEGVETLAQLARLRAHGCEFGQGYLFAPAATPAAFSDYLGMGTSAEGVAA